MGFPLPESPLIRCSGTMTGILFSSHRKNPSWLVHWDMQACVHQTFVSGKACDRAGTGDTVVLSRSLNPAWTKNSTRAAVPSLRQALLGIQTAAPATWLRSKHSDAQLVGTQTDTTFQKPRWPPLSKALSCVQPVRSPSENLLPGNIKKLRLRFTYKKVGRSDFL